jgi:pimeloyl-ACP methyl ester carboxylesterase
MKQQPLPELPFLLKEVGQHNNMRKQATHHFANVNNLRLHYIKYANEGKPTLLLLHGLTANCMAFEGLISHGLNDQFNIISVDLRGRGLSSQPIFGYTMKAHARDIIELLKHLKLDEVILVGHSYGGLLGSFLCYYYPQHFSKVVFLDAAPEMNPRTPEMLQAAFQRLDRIYPNKQAYFDMLKQAPFMRFWDKDIEAYYEADIEEFPDKTVSPRPDLSQIMQVSLDVGISPLKKYFKGIKQPSLIICATEEYNLGEAILPGYLAEKAVNNMVNADVEYVAANHFTLVYSSFAKEIVKYIEKFVYQN